MLKFSQPLVDYRETVKAESSLVVLAKSPNKHNRLYMKAEPLQEDLVSAIESGQVGPRTDPVARVRMLADEYGWDSAHAKKLWAFGPDSTGPNLLVDQSAGVQYLNEVKDSWVTGFSVATKEGVLCEESLRGVRMNVLDATVSLLPHCSLV